MKGTSLGGVVFAFLLLFAFTGCGEEVLLLNGATVSLVSPPVGDGDRLLVPLLEFSPYLGAEALLDPIHPLVAFRWTGGRVRIPIETFPMLSGVLYVRLDWLAELTGAKLHRIGDTVHVETAVAELTAFDVGLDRATVRFNGYAPLEVLSCEGTRVTLRFRSCSSSVPPRSIMLGSGQIKQADLLPQAGDTCVVSLLLREACAPHIERVVRDGFHATTISFDGDTSLETVTTIRPGWTLHEIDPALPASTGLAYAYIQIEDWRSDARLQPTASPFGIGTTAPLRDIVDHVSGELAIGMGDQPDLLVSDGMPICLEDSGGAILEFDLFGRPVFSAVSAAATLRIEGQSVPLSGVNRPLAYDQIVAYTKGYLDPIARGIPGTFTVLKIRQERIVSIYDGAFVFEDPTATLVIASGESKARLSAVQLGDRATIACVHPVDGDPMINAIGIDSILIENSRPVNESTDPTKEPAEACAWTVLAIDWHGGLIVVCVPRHQPNTPCTTEDIQGILADLPVPIRDAAVLHRGSTSSFALLDRGTVHEFGEPERAAAALCLVPIE